MDDQTNTQSTRAASHPTIGRFMRCVRGMALALVGTTIAASGMGYQAHLAQHVPLRSALDPTYWIRRMRGTAEYDPARRLLEHGSFGRREVALTIDDGPHPRTGSDMLDVLQRYGVHATFFVVGSRARQRPDLIRRMLADGHEIGNHSETHRRLDTLRPDQVRREMSQCEATVSAITGRRMQLMRPPGMRYDDTVLSIAREMDYDIVSWSAAAKDFLEQPPGFIVDRILRGTSSGSIILLHDDYPSTVTAMPRIITGLRAHGLRFVTVSEMLAHLPHPVIIGGGRPSMNHRHDGAPHA